MVRRRHKETWFNGSDAEEQYITALSEYLTNALIAEILVTELTRTVNLVITAVNEVLDPMYRFNEGAVRMISGDAFWGFSTSHPRFREIDWATFPRVYSLEDIRSRVVTEVGDQAQDGRSGVFRTASPGVGCVYVANSCS